MDKQIMELIQSLNKSPGVTDEALSKLMAEIGVRLPSQYIEFMKFTNGAEGAIGHSNYVVIWPMEEITSLNKEVAVNEFAPGLLLFAGDGGNTAYAFDTRFDEMPIVETHLDDMDLRNLKQCGSTFSAFLAYLAQK